MIYVASRASVEKYPREWRRLRSLGWPINSTWIDEAGPGETADLGELWQRIETEVRAARGVVLWAEAEDFPLKGAFIEVGMALGMGKPVAVYTRHVFTHRDYKPFGSWMNHPLVSLASSLSEALERINGGPLCSLCGGSGRYGDGAHDGSGRWTECPNCNGGALATYQAVQTKPGGGFFVHKALAGSLTAALDKLRQCPMDCESWGQCKANAHGVPADCKSPARGEVLPKGAKQ